MGKEGRHDLQQNGRLQLRSSDIGVNLTYKDRWALEKSNVLSTMPTDYMKGEWSLDRKFGVHLSLKNDFKAEADYKIKPEAVKWYTDGSRTSEGTGAGVTGPRSKTTIPMGKFPSGAAGHRELCSNESGKEI